MNIKFKSILLVSLITCFCVSQKCLATDVVVGTKTNATSGAVTISNSQIQQSILSTISDLAATTVTSNQPSISIIERITY